MYPRRVLYRLATTLLPLAMIATACGRQSDGPPGETASARADAAPGGALAGGRAAVYVVAHLQRVEGRPQELDRRVRLLRELGAGGTRLGFEWPALEPAAGSFDWSWQDTVVRRVSDAGLEIVGVLNHSPPWARPPGAEPVHRPVVGGSARRGDTAFARFAATAARRYAGRVDRWEIWNEPNIRRFWQHHREGGSDRGPSPSDYLGLFLLARDSIRAANPRAVVATAGLASGPARHLPAAGRPGFPAHEYLDSLVSTGIDVAAVGLHPYAPRPPEPEEGSGTGRTGRVMEDVLRVLARNGLGSTPLWITEWGVDRDAAPDEAAVRAWLQQGLSYLLCHPKVALVAVYALAPVPADRRYALVDARGELTPSGAALRALLTEWDGCG